MRLRNIPGAEEAVMRHPATVCDEKEQKGCWHGLFHNENPIHIEVGMGKGRFLLAMAKQNPRINYIGIERYTSVLVRALEKYDTEEYRDLANVRFLCMDAYDLPEVFADGEVQRIYLNFSDPWPKARHARRRLTSARFLAQYDRILARDGEVAFKTDNRQLFAFSLEQFREAGWTIVACTYDLHHDEQMNAGNVMTEYEERFSGRGNAICKLIATRERPAYLNKKEL